MYAIMPFHQRLAELWIKNQKNKLSEAEERELYLCMKANASYCWERAYLENLSLMASMVGDVDWQHEIVKEIENHE